MCDCSEILRLLKKYGFGNNWLALANSDITADKLLESVLSFLTIIATISGLIAGFSYVVVTQPPIEYKHKIFLGSDRGTVSGGFTIFAFLFAIVSVVSGALLYFFGSFGGEQHIKQWVVTFHRFIDVPAILLVLATYSIGCGALVHIGGTFNDALYYSLLSVGFVLFLGFLPLMVNLAVDQWKFLEQNTNQNNQMNQIINNTQN